MRPSFRSIAAHSVGVSFVMYGGRRVVRVGNHTARGKGQSPNATGRARTRVDLAKRSGAFFINARCVNDNFSTRDT